jgi:hypothetical protein
MKVAAEDPVGRYSAYQQPAPLNLPSKPLGRRSFPSFCSMFLGVVLEVGVCYSGNVTRQKSSTRIERQYFSATRPEFSSVLV